MIESEIQQLFSRLSVKLIFKQTKLVTVESCTGGMIGKFATDLTGSSSWFEAGLITYSNQAKNKLASVPMSLIDKYGAVSLEVADAMVSGTLRQFPNCVAVAVTGIAGPSGGSRDKPVGTVCIATRFADQVKTRRFSFDGDRNKIRLQTVQESLNLLLSMDFE